MAKVKKIFAAIIEHNFKIGTDENGVIIDDDIHEPQDITFVICETESEAEKAISDAAEVHVGDPHEFRAHIEIYFVRDDNITFEKNRLDWVGSAMKESRKTYHRNKQ